MKKAGPNNDPRFQARCCPSGRDGHDEEHGFTRREFFERMGAVSLSSVAIGKLSWSQLAGISKDSPPIPRRSLRVKPILLYSTPQPQYQRSWRSWGGIQTEEQSVREANRIQVELATLKKRADFPLEFTPVDRIQNKNDIPGISELSMVDVLLIYAAGGWMDTFSALEEQGKDMIFFCRHKSGPVYLWYEIISPRYLRQHTDSLAVKCVDDGDVVIDSQDEILWRLRALAGLKNTRKTRILAVGGPGAWSQPKGVVPDLVKKIWNFDIRTVSYDDLGKKIEAARADQPTMTKARERAEKYLRGPGVSLETRREYVDNAFLLDEVFRAILAEAECRTITINGCMGTIMPYAETSACLTLSILNDSGYRAFCESDFVVIPSGILLADISGRPVFMNDPTYPHDGLITLAHCTAPRKMNGETLEPARLLTHFESDYGVAPKVEMRRGETVTNIIPDFKSERWVGLKGQIVDVPFLDICRSQIDIRFDCDSQILAERMPGFHWITGYGDYTREIGYALKRVGINWELL